MHKIIIPSPENDQLGTCFRALLDSLIQFNKCRDNNKILIDLSSHSFVHPFLILPLSALIQQLHQQNIEYEIKDSIQISSYLNTVYFPHGIDPLLYNDWEKKLAPYRNKTYLPICRIPVKNGTTFMREQLLSTFEEILVEQSELKGQILSVVKYLISEAMDNIVDHSKTEAGWIFIQNYPVKGFMDICILDTGIGLLGSYEKFNFSKIDTDYKALHEAVNGKSTKQIAETRGYGIDTSRRMLVDGLKGKYLLFSGSAFYIYTEEIEQIVPLSVEYKWFGTLLTLRLPNFIPDNFNYISYLE